MVGTGRGAQLGILIKGPEVLESTRAGRHRRPRQDRHRHHRADDAASTSSPTPASTPDRGAAPGRRARGRLASTRSPRRSPRGRGRAASAELPAGRPTSPAPRASASRGVVDGRAVMVGRPSLLADWAERRRVRARRALAEPPQTRAGRPAGPRSRSAGTAGPAACSSSPTRSSRPSRRGDPPAARARAHARSC